VGGKKNKEWAKWVFRNKVANYENWRETHPFKALTWWVPVKRSGVEGSATTYKELCRQSKDGIRFFQFPLELRRRRLQEKKRRVGKETLSWLPTLSSSVILWKKATLAPPNEQRRSVSFGLQKHNEKQHPTTKYTKP
jgi:hypothetical protein